MKLKKTVALLMALLMLTFVSCHKEETTTEKEHTSAPSVSETPDPGEIPPGCPHLHTKKIKDQDTTCMADGYEDRLMCEDCGAILDTTGTVIPATGHIYKDGVCIHCKKYEPDVVMEGNFPDSDVKYTLYSDGELAVTGKGAIPSFKKDENSFFYKFSKVVKTIVIYNGVTNVGDFAFRGLKSVKELYLPSTLKIIGEHAFDGWSLKKIEFSNGIRHIGDDNFQNHHIYFLDLPTSLNYVGAGSFDSESLMSMRIPYSIQVFKARENQFSKVENIAYMGSEESFNYFELARHLQIDGNCSMVNILYNYTGKSSKLPYCFKRGEREGDFTYICYTDDTCRISSYNGDQSEIVIPEKLGKFKVVAIDRNAFEGNSKIKKVTLPECFEKIYDEAFLDAGIKELVVTGKELKVGKNAFSNAKYLKTISFDGAFVDVGAGAFYNCPLENIPLSENMKVIRESAFVNSEITKVDFSKIRVIGPSAFALTDLGGKLDLTGVKKIGMGAFYRAKVKTVNLTGVEIIEEAAFTYNSSLDKEGLTGTESLKKVHPNAFDFEL